MSILTWIVLFCLLAGVLSVLAAAAFLLLGEAGRARLMPHLISFATGTLLGVAFIALLPHALEYPGMEDSHAITLTVLAGLLGFFLLEKLVLWRHCHHDDCEAHAIEATPRGRGISGPLILLGDSVHNFIHGLLIAASFLADIHIGIVTSMAVIAHQIPQELSNFAVLLHRGMPRGRALGFNLLSSVVAVLGGVSGFTGLAGNEWLLPHMLAVAVASCIYIAVGDLIPGMHKVTQLNVSMQQVLLIIAGVMVIYTTHSWLH